MGIHPTSMDLLSDKFFVIEAWGAKAIERIEKGHYVRAKEAIARMINDAKMGEMIIKKIKEKDK